MSLYAPPLSWSSDNTNGLRNTDEDTLCFSFSITDVLLYQIILHVRNNNGQHKADTIPG